MSGLGVVFCRDGRPASASVVEAMLAAIPYWGPDGQWVQTRQSVAFGYAKLTVTPEEEAEQQPLESPRSSCLIVADVRLDNREELLEQLGDAPSPAATDAELILRAYEAWGLDAPARLLGDFAFVVWDPHRRRIVCARDASGQRPLYYRLDRATFAAASDIHQLFQDPSVPIAPNEERIRDYLTPFRVFRNDQEQGATFFAGIQTLLAGHLLVVDAAGHRLQRYWELQPRVTARLCTDDDYAWHFQQLLAQATRARLRTSRPVGAMLSGGLDSSAVVSVAQRVLPSCPAAHAPFTAYSMSVGDLGCDESRFIDDVQAMYGFEARMVPVMGRMANFEPSPGGFIRAPMKPVCEVDLLLQAAAEGGARVMLSGHWADNCFPWTAYFFGSLLRRGRFGEAWRHLRVRQRTTDDSLRKLLAVHCVLPVFPLFVQRLALEAYARWTFQHEQTYLVPQWMDPAVRADLLIRHQYLSVHAARERRFGDESRQMMFSSLVPAEVQPIAGTSPVQLAPPFADRRLHEFMLSIPPEQIYSPHPYADQFYAGHKLILRRAMNGIMPETVRARTQKTVFSALVLDEVQRNWGDISRAFGPGAPSELAERGYVEPRKFWDRLQRLRDGAFGNDGVYLMRALNLETWLRTFRLPRDQHRRVAAATAPHGGEQPYRDRPRTAADAHTAPLSGGAVAVEIGSGRR